MSRWGGGSRFTPGALSSATPAYPLLAPNNPNSTPSYSFAGASGTGMTYTSNNLRLVYNGAQMLNIGTGSINFGGANQIRGFVRASTPMVNGFTQPGQAGDICHNGAAAADIEGSLGLPTGGTVFIVHVRNPYYIRLNAPTGSVIRTAAGDSAVAGYIRSNAVGSALYMVHDSTTKDWFVLFQSGTWTIDS